MTSRNYKWNLVSEYYVSYYRTKNNPLNTLVKEQKKRNQIHKNCPKITWVAELYIMWIGTYILLQGTNNWYF